MPLRHRLLIFALLLLGTLGPLVLYALTLGRAPSLTPIDAQNLLDDQDTGVVFVDVTSPAPNLGLPNATALPLPTILKLRSPQDLPAALRNQTLLLLCPGGLQSAQAALHLQHIGVPNAFAIRGGQQEWIATSQVPYVPRFTRDPSHDCAIPNFRPATALEQFAAVFTFFGLKFLYTLLSAILIVVLWKQRAPDLVALRWSLIAFFIGEACCFFNVMLFFEDNQLLEHLHSVGMVLTFAFVIWAVLEFFDSRIIHVSDSARCALLPLCRDCIKYHPVPCGSRRLFLILIPAAALLAFVPLCSTFRHQTVNTRIYGMLHAYTHPAIHQLYELRVLPVCALVLLVAAFLVLLFHERHPTPVTKILFAAAAGALSFSYFRMLLVSAFIDHLVWSDAWEETTELMYTVLFAVVLFLFRRALFAPADAKTPIAPSPH